MLELALGMAVLALIAGAVAPITVNYARQEAGQKTAREVRAILEAGQAFFVGTHRWPTGIAELREAGHLPAGFSQSPFATAYVLEVSGSQLQVTVPLPNDIAPGVARLLPLSATTASGGTAVLTARAPVPGTSSDSTLLLHRQGTLVGSTMSGPLEVNDQSGSGGTNVRSLGSSSKNVFEGNVGIGTATPGAKLDVRNDGTATESAIVNVLSGSSGHSQINLWTAAEPNRNRIKSYPDRVSIGAGGQAEALHVRDNNVGIGTADPAQKLHLSASEVELNLESTRNVSRPWVLRNNYGPPGNALLFMYGPDTSQTKVTFDHSGNVGIGTTSPGTKLDVNGDVSSSDITLRGAGGRCTLTLANYSCANFGSGAITLGSSNGLNLCLRGCGP